MASQNARVLVIPDMHMPFCHPDTWKFLAAVKRKYKPDRVVCLGDEVDGHALSYHESDPDLDSAGPELEKAIRFLRPLYKLFPRVDVLESNHGSLVYRKAKSAGIPRRALKSYRDTLDAPRGWVWHFDLTIQLSNGQLVYFHHGKTKAHGKLSQRQSMCAVQGHFHSEFHVTYWANPVALFWDAHAGCLFDHKSLAAAYGQNCLEKGVVGCLVILAGHPHLVPMPLKRNGRWTGDIP
jgi:predicted MPP superfamily phosphohydrolase